VAANVSLQRQMVFSHHETPHCQVSDAVMASCSLPFAFRNSDLVATNDQDHNKYVHTVVDGGVWSNFPIWIFTDAAFHDWAERTDVPDVDGVVGFVLREPRPDESLEDARFHRYAKSDGLLGRLPFPAFEWRESSESSILNALPLLAPTKLLDNLDVRTFSRGRWPEAKGRVGRFFGSIIESWLRLMSAAPIGAAVLLAALYGGYVVYRWADKRSAVGNGLLGVGITAVEATYLLGGITITLLTLFFLNFLLGTSIRRIGYGLVRTFAAAPGAPQWVEKREDVIAVDLPPEATTLNFDLDPEILVAAGLNAVTANLAALRQRLS
jgi:Patatin-like phospholipase